MGLLKPFLRLLMAALPVLALAECGLLQETPKVDTGGCYSLCVTLKSCGLLPSALGTTEDNCESRCIATQKAEARHPADANDATGGTGQAGSMSSDESTRILSCLNGKRPESGYWCKESEGATGGASAQGSSGASVGGSGGASDEPPPMSCRDLMDCLGRQLTNDAATGRATVSVLLAGEARRNPPAEACLYDWTTSSSTCDVPKACEGVSDVTLLGELGAAVEGPNSECTSWLDKAVLIGSIRAGVHEPRFKILRQDGCVIRTGHEQLAQAGVSVVLEVPFGEPQPESGTGEASGDGGASSCGGSDAGGGTASAPESDGGSGGTEPLECETGDKCSDKVDNDGDGRTDCDDPACAKPCPAVTQGSGGMGGGGPESPDAGGMGGLMSGGGAN